MFQCVFLYLFVNINKSHFSAKNNVSLMEFKALYLAFIIIICSVKFSDCNKTVKIDVYYESLCQASKSFIANKLVETYKTLGDKYLDVNLVPFGNAKLKTNNKGLLMFMCQHGKEECKGNKIHGCVLRRYWSKGPESRRRVLEFIACMFKDEEWKEPEKAGKKCAEKYFEGQWETIHQCATSYEGRKIFNDFYKETISLEPPKKGVPWILFDGRYDKENHSRARRNLLKLLCEMLEDENLPQCS